MARGEVGRAMSKGLPCFLEAIQRKKGELGKEGGDVECHSMTHPQLSKKVHAFNGSKPRLLTPEEYDQFLTTETLGAKQILERELNKKIIYFAYPYGDYNKTVEAKAVAQLHAWKASRGPVAVAGDNHDLARNLHRSVRPCWIAQARTRSSTAV